MTGRRLHVTRAARGDLENLRRRTIDAWGRDRWLRYYAGLEATFERARAEPRSGRERKTLAPGLRSMLYRAHVVFSYETLRGDVVTLRVLHQKQNAEALNWADRMEE